MSEPNADQWEEIYSRGGKSLDVRVVAHTTIYHEATNSLIVYGGVVVNVARFSKLSDRMFVFHLVDLHWTEIHYPRMQLRDAYIPRERAFHTANVIGNYMIVFGGYTHRHNKEEMVHLLRERERKKQISSFVMTSFSTVAFGLFLFFLYSAMTIKCTCIICDVILGLIQMCSV